MGCSPSEVSGGNDTPEQTVVAPLELTGRVVDAADIVPAEREVEWTDRLAKLEEKTLAQVVIVTTPDMGGMAIDDYGLALGNGWGIGNAERDDGVLLIVAPNERKTRLEVGLGLEKLFTFERSTEIVDKMLVHYRDAAYVDGIEAGLQEVERDLTENAKLETKIAA